MVGMTRMDSVRNEVVHSRVGMERETDMQNEPEVLVWFGHGKIMDEQRTAKKY